MVPKQLGFDSCHVLCFIKLIFLVDILTLINGLFPVLHAFCVLPELF